MLYITISKSNFVNNTVFDQNVLVKLNFYNFTKISPQFSIKVINRILL